MKKRILALLMALLLLLCAACGGSAGGSSASSGNGNSMASDMAPEAPSEAEKGEGWVSSDSAYDYSTESGETGGSAETPDKAVDPSEKIIYSASLSIETLEFDASVAALEKMAAELGGFVESSQVSGSTRRQSDGTTRVVDRYAYYTIRVPVARFSEALTRAGDLGSVTSSSKNAENITSMFTDQEARKHSLEVQEERLLEMLEKAEDVDTLVTLESRLSEVRYEIESIERTLRNWQNQVDYSTVSVSLQEVAVYTPTVSVQRSFGQKLADAFADGWDGFVEFLQDFTLFIAESLPGLILLAAVVVVAVLLARRVLRRRRARRQGSSAPDEKKEG